MTEVTVVIPVLDDFDALARQLAGLGAQPGVALAIVDGGHDIRLESLVLARNDVGLLRGATGRGAQMNRGARASSGRWLLFLHADCRLPSGWRESLAGLEPDVVGGWFRFALDDTAWQARVLEWLVAWRVRLFGLAYGDQGVFVRTEVFARMDGFKDWPLMEDVDFVRRLRQQGRVASLASPIHSSSRRWRRDGWIPRSARNLCLIALYFLGVSPHSLARMYASKSSLR